MIATIEDLKIQILCLQNEINNVKTAAKLYNNQKEEEYKRKKKDYDEELFFLRNIVNEYLVDTTHSMHENLKLSDEKKLLKKRLEHRNILSSISTSSFKDGGGILDNVFKPFRKVSSNINWNSKPSEDVEKNDNDADLENTMLKAKEETDKLRAIVLPLENEIAWLKCRLKDSQIRNSSSTDEQIFQSFKVSPIAQKHMRRTSSLPLQLNSYNLRILPTYFLLNKWHSLDSYLPSDLDIKNRMETSKTANFLDILIPNSSSHFETYQLKCKKHLVYPRNLSCNEKMGDNIVIEDSKFPEKNRKNLPNILWVHRSQEKTIEFRPNTIKLDVPETDDQETPIQSRKEECNEYEKDILQNEIAELKSNLKSETIKRSNLEDRFHAYCDNMKDKISILIQQINEAESKRNTLQQECENVKRDLKYEIEELCDRMNFLKKKMYKVMNENLTLLGKHSTKSKDMQDKMIDLPNNIEDLQIYLLKLGEDYISSQIAKEYCEERCAQKIEVLKQNLQSEIESNNSLQIALQQLKINEIDESVSVMNEKRPFPISHLENVLALARDGKTQLPSPLIPTPATNLLLHHQHYPTVTDYSSIDILGKNIAFITASTTKCLGCNALINNPAINQTDQTFLNTENSGHCQKCGEVFCLSCLSRRTIISKCPSTQSYQTYEDIDYHQSSTQKRKVENGEREIARVDDSSIVPIAKVYKVCERCYRNALSC
ncbi:uncharacterized protein LOC135931495 isoform X3 [Gordionus sp. m RMFG-2023]|uniref:uncharacterized protein LOC135931495 isoform X3 n=1 Tax=Gordionus sp. m RMFG-2023 TaxID=3053472 RepID=UPI0031FC2BE9